MRAAPLRFGKNRRKTNGNDKQSVVPERADIIFRNRFADNPRLVVYFVAQRSRPNLQKPKSERDQPSREPTFDLQFFLRFAGTLFSPQR